MWHDDERVGLREDHAVDRRLVETLSQHRTVGHGRRLAGVQPVEDRTAFIRRRGAVQGVSGDTHRSKRIGHRIGDLNGRCEHERPPIFAYLEVGGLADQLGRVALHQRIGGLDVGVITM